jgi:nucleoside phosphorylase
MMVTPVGAKPSAAVTSDRKYHGAPSRVIVRRPRRFRSIALDMEGVSIAVGCWRSRAVGAAMS